MQKANLDRARVTLCWVWDKAVVRCEAGFMSILTVCVWDNKLSPSESGGTGSCGPVPPASPVSLAS